MKEQLTENFASIYNAQPTATYFAPGRVNLIGEHIDYNGGLVMPCAITAGTWLLMAPNNENKIRFASLNFEEQGQFDLQPSYNKTGKTWYNYPLGVIHELQQLGWAAQGIDLLYFGNIPIGSGLSSSASIEVLTAVALNHYYNLGHSKLELVKLTKRVENHFIGVNSGIMDQFAVAFGQADKALVLNCDTLDYQLVDCNLGDYQLAIINTKKPRTLADSKYNERVEECQTALKALQKELDIAYLCELDANKFDKHKHLIENVTVLNRATHVVNENDRVHQAASALNAGNLDEFGELMYASHDSLSAFYDVSGKELDTIVDFCKHYNGVIGARMTGAGFGGCAIALLKKGAEHDFSEKLIAHYTEKIGYPAEIYIHQIGDGAKAI